MLRFVGELAYRVGLAAQASDEPDLGVVEAVEGPNRLPPGHALDLGCGTGRNSIYLARHSWEVTGIDMIPDALAATRRNAALAGVTVRVIEGDVTRLEVLGIGRGYTLLVDVGCYHMVSVAKREAYAAGVTTVAAPGALLMMVGFTKLLRIGMTAEELRNRFSGWELVRTMPVPGREMRRYVRGPALTKAVLSGSWFEPWRYELLRSPTRAQSAAYTSA